MNSPTAMTDPAVGNDAPSPTASEVPVTAKTAPESTPTPSGLDRESLPPLLKDWAFLGMLSTQFLGAFNDNLFKQLVLLLAVALAATNKVVGDPYQTTAQVCFALPFILFSGSAGYLADRYGKRTIFIICKVIEIVVMATGLLVLLLFAPESDAAFWCLTAVLFVMGAQSAFFGPAKYGILPEMIRDRDLPNANGLVQMTTFLAIIFGTALAGVGVEWLGNRLWVLLGGCVLLAIAGTQFAFLVRKLPASRPELAFSKSHLFISRETWSLIRGDSLLLRVLLVSSLFWLAGGVVLPNVNALGKFHFQLDKESWISWLTAALGVGIMFGCVLAGVLSRDRVRFGLVRLGTFGMLSCFVLLYLVTADPAGFALTYFLSFSLLVLAGFFAGLFAVPMQVFLQARPPAGQKGRMIAAMNLFNWIGIVLAAPLYGLCSSMESIPAVGAAYPRYTFLVLAGILLPIGLLFRPADEPLK